MHPQIKQEGGFRVSTLAGTVPALWYLEAATCWACPSLSGLNSPGSCRSPLHTSHFPARCVMKEQGSESQSRTWGQGSNLVCLWGPWHVMITQQKLTGARAYSLLAPLLGDRRWAREPLRVSASSPAEGPCKWLTVLGLCLISLGRVPGFDPRSCS